MTKEILMSEWKGSANTASMVAHEIASRWCDEEVKNYNPRENCFTFQTWKKKGYKVKKGEKGIRSITFISGDVKNKKTGEVKDGQFPKTVVLFYHLQVEKIDDK